MADEKHLTSLETVFRDHYKNLVASLIRSFGSQNLEEIENSLSEAFLKATSSWPNDGIPGNPKGWLFTVAKNQILDTIKTESRHTEKHLEISTTLQMAYELGDDELVRSPLIADARIKTAFLCSSPLLPEDDQIALSLRIAFGLDSKSIARLYLITPDNLDQRLSRAKKKFKSLEVSLEVEGEDLSQRVNSLLKVFYFLFTQGYSALEQDPETSERICWDALNLLRLLHEEEKFASSEGWALLAIFCFQSARSKTRIDVSGKGILLKDQNRAAWDQDLINAGFYYQKKSMSGSNLSPYHLEAKIGATHSLAQGFDSTDWNVIADTYDQLFAMTQNASYLVNSAAADLFRGDLKPAAAKLESIASLAPLKRSYEYHMLLGDLLTKQGHPEKGHDAFTKAEKLSQYEFQRRAAREKIIS